MENISSRGEGRRGNGALSWGEQQQSWVSGPKAKGGGPLFLGGSHLLRGEGGFGKWYYTGFDIVLTQDIDNYIEVFWLPGFSLVSHSTNVLVVLQFKF